MVATIFFFIIGFNIHVILMISLAILKRRICCAAGRVRLRSWWNGARCCSGTVAFPICWLVLRPTQMIPNMNLPNSFQYISIFQSPFVFLSPQRFAIHLHALFKGDLMFGSRASPLLLSMICLSGELVQTPR